MLFDYNFKPKLLTQYVLIGATTVDFAALTLDNL